MAIFVSRTKEEYEADPQNIRMVTSYDTDRIHHYWCCVSGTRPDGAFGQTEPHCPHYNDPTYTMSKGPQCGEKCYAEPPKYLMTTYVGKCLFEREENGYHDSYFYMTVWDEDTQSPKEVCFGATAYGGWVNPTTDATDEVKAKYEAYITEKRRQYDAMEALRRAKTPEKGKVCKVVKGRKVPIGTIGVVFWFGPERYSNGRKVGLVDSQGVAHWTYEGNLEAVLEHGNALQGTLQRNGKTYIWADAPK